MMENINIAQVKQLALRNRIHDKEHCIFKDDVIKTLAQYNWSSLKILKITEQESLDDEECLHLANIRADNLKSLILNGNYIGSKGCFYLSRAKWPNL